MEKLHRSFFFYRLENVDSVFKFGLTPPLLIWASFMRFGVFSTFAIFEDF